MPPVTLLRRPAPSRITHTCGGSLNPLKPCQAAPTVVQIHRHATRSTDPTLPPTVDVAVRLCASHAARLHVGRVVRGVTIVSQDALS